jgi:membrane-associated PAP2 superfamily phosphatase
MGLAFRKISGNGTAQAPQGRGTSPAGFPFADPIVLTLLYLAAVSALFIAFPNIDTAVAGLFHDASGFPASRMAGLIKLRRLGDQLVMLVLIGLVASWIAKIVWPLRPIAIRPRTTLFLLASLILGPGLVVNGLLKSFSGRPRPIQVDLFGGNEPFVHAWSFAGQCASNCSFVAGEASSAMWLLALAFLAPKPLRLWFAIPLGLLALALSVNRMAFGGHFLSDVMISWGLTLLVILLLYRVLVIGPAGKAIDRWIGRQLTLAGFALQKALGRYPADKPEDKP